MGSPRKADSEAANNPDNKIKQKGIKMKDRHCTDMLFCLFFVVWIVGIFVISVYGIMQGDPYKIATPFDSDGNQCGMPNQTMTIDPNDSTKNLTRDFTDYKYKSFTALHSATSGSSDMYHAVCVKECPKDAGDKMDCLPTMDDTSCPFAYFGTERTVTYCLPGYNETSEAIDLLYEQLNEQYNLGSYIVDIAGSW